MRFKKSPNGDRAWNLAEGWTVVHMARSDSLHVFHETLYALGVRCEDVRAADAILGHLTDRGYALAAARWREVRVEIAKSGAGQRRPRS